VVFYKIKNYGFRTILNPVVTELALPAAREKVLYSKEKSFYIDTK
jgi:hypothetical protein